MALFPTSAPAQTRDAKHHDPPRRPVAIALQRASGAHVAS
jgi:hypothetical protein